MILDWQSVSALIFIIVLSALLLRARKQITVQGLFPLFYFVMYKTKLGLSTMDSWAKRFPKTIRVFAMTGIGVGFLGMIFIVFEIVKNAIALITTPSAVAGVQLVLPIQAKGVFFVPFLYWIISIFVIAVMHEFSHGVVARLFKIPVKSSGFAFLGILAPIVPAAFVEPDEKVLAKKPLKEKLGVFAAGPFANILFAFALLLVLWLVVNPATNSMILPSQPIIELITPDSPLDKVGISSGEQILSIDGSSTSSIQALALVLKTKKP
ncbi:MAG: site-2 protease family protein, partial [Candidatus Woesearchaeota archaeon]|nr:site-2 protease family protein [Candidatus Woesearchaeota archaeon]